MKKAFWHFWFTFWTAAGLGAAELPCWEFPAALREWSQAQRLVSTAVADGVQLDCVARDSYLVNPDVSLAAGEIGGWAIEYRAEGFATATTGQIYYGTAEAPGFGQERVLPVGSLVVDGRWHTMKILTDSAWRTAGTVTRLRLDLVDQAPGRLWLRKVRALPPTPTREELRGIPVQVPVELGSARSQWLTMLWDPKAPRFASPMAAPADGGFEYVGKCFLRKEFELKNGVRRALFLASCDDRMLEAYVNGRRLDVAWSYNWKIPNIVELPPELLRRGRNVLCLSYLNGGGLGGVMADLQVVDSEGDFQLVTMAGAKGFFGAEPAADWASPETACTWGMVETRPGAPNPPWRFTPEYRSIDPALESVEVILPEYFMATEHKDVAVVFRGGRQIGDDEVFYLRVLDAKGMLLGYCSGTAAELNAEELSDGGFRVHFDRSSFGLRYGAAARVRWQVGVYGRSGGLDFWQDLPDRPLAGEPVSLKLAQTPGGPVPMLNGQPFYLVSLCIEKVETPTGVEGPSSSFNVICTRAGGFLGDRSRWWVGPDQYDFSVVDRQLSLCAEKYPNAWLGLYVWCHPGEWYARLFPERLAVQDDGQVVEKRLAAGCPVAFSNEAYRQDAELAVRALVRHCEEYFGSRMVFYNLQGGITYEWQGWNSHTKFFGDYAAESQQDFRRYAAAHGLEVPGVPTRAEREAGLPGGLLRDPVRDAASILYERFYSESIAECIDRIARVVREETHGDKLVGAYYGYHQEFAGLGYCVNGGGHNDLHRLLESPNLDFFLSPIDYRHRSIGAPSSDMKPYGAIRAAGKLALSEDDTRTNRIAATNFDQTLNMEQTLAVLKRNHGVALTRGMALNHLPLVGGTELDAPEIREMLEQTRRAGQAMVEENHSPKAEIAVVLDEEALALFVPTLQQIFVPDPWRYHYDPANGKLVESFRGVQPLSGELLADQQLALSQCGAPADWLMLQEPQSLAGYKLVIFAGTFLDSPQLREALRVVEENEATTLFLYGAGFMTAQGTKPENMSQLIGIDFVMTKQDSLVVAIGPEQTVGVDYPVAPRFAVSDAEAVPLARYASDHALAAARKGRRIFYGGAALDAQWLREIAREAGVHIYTESDDNFFAGGDFLCIHADSSGTKRISLPRRTDAVEIYTGEVIGRAADVLEFPMAAFETKVIMLGDAETIRARLGFN